MPLTKCVKDITEINVSNGKSYVSSIFDEFDSGIHDILVKDIIENVYPSIKGQLILTTHNTYLLESDIPKECMYSFKLDSFANK